MKLIRTLPFFCLILHVTCLFAQSEKLDLNVLQQIRKEGLENSRVMDIVFQLTDVNGPRLTGSPGFMKAANYAKSELEKWGLSNAVIESWGEFGKGWTLERSYLAMKTPYYRPLIAFPKSWTSGT